MRDVCGQTLRLPALVKDSCRSSRRVCPERVFVLLVSLSVQSFVNVHLYSSRPAAASNLDHVRLRLPTSKDVNSVLRICMEPLELTFEIICQRRILIDQGFHGPWTLAEPTLLIPSTDRQQAGT